MRPCPYRQVDDEGHILCDKIKTGDREVSPNICRACPVSAINCSHLRATLDHQARPPLTVRYGNGKTEIWDDLSPSINLQTAACAAKVVPIHSPRDCAACPIRQPLISAESIHPFAPAVSNATPAASAAAKRQQGTRRAPHAAPTPVMAVSPVAATVPTAPAADARSNIVAQKIIQLQEWLAGRKAQAMPAEEANAVTPLAVGARTPISSLPRAPVAEEKRVGWTD
jgi:hypothetical protein